jgi:phage terminase large subunit-like protein
VTHDITRFTKAKIFSEIGKQTPMFARFSTSPASAALPTPSATSAVSRSSSTPKREGGRRRIALVGPTAADARNVMVEGESGILAISPDPERPLYEPRKRRLTWPNGAVATTYSADEPERLRGPQHDAAWCDELAAWRYPEAWDMLMFRMRLGADPRTVVTTTPRPAKLIRDLVRDPICVVTRGASYENRGNLAPGFFDQIIRKYQGTRLGRQELEAELLEDTPGALWSHASIEASRLRSAPEMTRVVVAIDPAVTSGDEADETGIVVAGKDKSNPRRRGRA